MLGARSYQNVEALKSLEDSALDQIRAGERGGRSTADLQIELAETRIQFEQWQGALDALKKADNEDQRGLRGQSIDPLRAVAYCGLGKLPQAARILRDMTADERAQLQAKYPVLEKLQKDSNYRDLFPTSR